MQLAWRLQRLSWRDGERPLESPVDYPLVDVPEEGRDVLAPFRRLVIPHEGLLPDTITSSGLKPAGTPS
jgi:hypothetical protein